MDSECRICGDTGEKETFTAREMMFGTGEEFSYFLCGACGCLQISESPADISAYYPDGYYSLGRRPIDAGGTLARALRRSRTSYALEGTGFTGRLLTSLAGPPSLPRWTSLAGARTDSRILDVGCGSGRSLMYLHSQGFRDLTGVDPYMDDESRTDGPVTLHKAPVDRVEGHFDIILFDHSLEHIQDQKGTIGEAAGRLAEGGRLVVRIPLVSSQAWREYGTHWVQLDAPRHLFLHSRRSLMLLAGAAGLEVRKVEYDSTAFQFWGSEQYRMGIPLTCERSMLRSPPQPVFSTKAMKAFEKRAAALNEAGEGDQATFILERKA